MLEKVEDVKNIEQTDENSHIFSMWEPLDFRIDERYKYVNKNIFLKTCSDLLYYIIAAPVLTVLTKLLFGFEIKGKENLQQIKKGAISVSNHVHVLDCAMIGLSMLPRKIFFTASEAGFKMPIVRHIVKLLNAIPIPSEISNKKNFVLAIDELLENNEIVHFYPEASLWPYYNKLRNFKNGPFDIAIRNNVPIIPMVYSYRKPTGIRKFIKSKPFFTLNILKPVYPNIELSRKECLDDLKERAYKKMKDNL